MSFGSIILRLSKIQHHLPPKLAIPTEEQTVLWMVTVFLDTLFTKYLFVQLLINIIMVLVKILSKNVTITINVLLEINLVKGIPNYTRMDGSGKREIIIALLIGILL